MKLYVVRDRDHLRSVHHQLVKHLQQQEVTGEPAQFIVVSESESEKVAACLGVDPMRLDLASTPLTTVVDISEEYEAVELPEDEDDQDDQDDQEDGEDS